MAMTWDEAKGAGLLAIASDPVLGGLWDTKDLTALEMGLAALGIPFAGIRVGRTPTSDQDRNATNFPQPVWGTKAVEFANRLRDQHAFLMAMRPYGDNLSGLWAVAQADIDTSLKQVFLLGWTIREEHGKSDDVIADMFNEFDLLAKPMASFGEAMTVSPMPEKPARGEAPEAPPVLVLVGATCDGESVWGSAVETDPRVVAKTTVLAGEHHGLVVCRRRFNGVIAIVPKDSPDVTGGRYYEVTDDFPAVFDIRDAA